VKIAGEVAIVTGASSGIGAAVALDLAQRGAVVVGAARREKELEAVIDGCRRHQPASLAVVADLADPHDCERLVTTAAEHAGQPGIVVNNAGISLHRDARATTPADVQHVLQVNFMAAVHVTMGALPAMLDRRRGSIVNVTSVAGYVPSPKESAYSASKAALHLWTHGLAVDLHGTGVHAGVLSPGPIDTEIWDKDETPSSFQGKKYPPELVAEGVARMIEREVVHMTVPRRFGAVGALYALPGFGRAMRRGIVAFEAKGVRRRIRA
jgi:short-subunit dehydrogenase